jgi:mannobiose 2-epimerase
MPDGGGLATGVRRPQRTDMKKWLGLTLALLALCGGRAAPVVADYARLTGELDTHFREQVLKVWFPRCVDLEHGGFFPEFREDWTRGADNAKTIVYQARQTWTCAQVAQRYPELAVEFRGYAQHGLKFLDATMWDAENGGFFWGLDEHGKISPRFDAEKHVYGISFGLYAASACAAAHDEHALDLARRTFNWLEAHAHDAKNGGYFEALTRAGQPILAPVGARMIDALGTRYGCKSMNSHIHLLESVTALFQVWPDPLVRERLDELLGLVRDRITVAPGCMNLFFTPDWRALPDHDSFGHDVETAFLMVEAVEALGRPHDERSWRVARSLVDHALEFGWDEARGGFYDKGAAFAPAHGRDKIWWVQAEGLNALLLMHERYGRETDRYWRAFLKQWDFIQKFQTDAHYGEWFNTVSEEGRAAPGQSKGSIWKAAYHNGRALMFTGERLRRLARETH